jgi:hypothetical protein
MAIVKYPPNTIWLGGGLVIVNDVAASEAITPGMLIERFNSSGTPLFRKQLTALLPAAPIFALNQSMLNKGVDDVYNIGDLVEAGIGQSGSTFWALIGVATIVQGDQMEAAGGGLLQKKTTGIPIAIAVEGKVGAAGTTRLRVEIL